MEGVHTHIVLNRTTNEVEVSTTLTKVKKYPYDHNTRVTLSEAKFVELWASYLCQNYRNKDIELEQQDRTEGGDEF